MIPKNEYEARAAEEQVQLLTEALTGAVDGSGYWMNMAGRYYPRFYPKGPEISPFNALTLGLFSDRKGYKTGLYTFYPEAKMRNEPVKEGEKGVSFNWYNWKEYINRHDPNDKITRQEYLLLEPDDKKQYKGIHSREIRKLFNIDQTMMPLVDPDIYSTVIGRYGTLQERGREHANERELITVVNNFIRTMKDNMVPIRRDGTAMVHYNVAKDVIYVPDRKCYPQYIDYVQDLMRELARATGHRQRCAREGMVMRGGVAPSEEAVKHEELVVELVAGIKMLELGLPARLLPTSLNLVEEWNKELKEDLQIIDTIEADVNNAVDVIRRAEKGEKIVYFSEVNRLATEEMKDKKKPSVSSEESAVLTDIIRNRGMLIADGNFDTEEDKNNFLEKFDLTYHYNQFNHAMALTKDEDPEVVEVAFSEALRCSSYIDELARGYKPSDWTNTGIYTIYNALKEIPDQIARDFVIVSDPKKNRADVILPEGAFTGGKVILPDGKIRNFYLSPDEVMSAEERSGMGARVQNNELPGMSKQRIGYALQKQGVKYVRFFNTGGIASFHPNDAYFDGKRVGIAKLSQWELADVREMNISEAVERSRSVYFNKIQMVQDDSNRWLIYIAPIGEVPFFMHPDKSDVNQFFSTSKQGNNVATEKIRQELGLKYYAMSRVNPTLRIELKQEKASEEDASRISRVSLYKNKSGQFMCEPVIEGMTVDAREITKLQWQLLYLLGEYREYKENLAASVFADVLHPQQDNTRMPEQNQETMQTGGMRR